MSTETTHYHFVKPDYAEETDIGDVNDSMDLIDSELYRMSGVCDETVDTVEQAMEDIGEAIETATTAAQTATTAATSATSAASSATSAATSASQAATSASSAASDASDAAESATQAATDASAAAEDALEAAEEAREAAGGTVPVMSASQRGGAKLGAGLEVGSDEKLGVKVDGTTIGIDSNGALHGASTYTLPPATTSTLGGVKPDGTTITVTSDGTISGADTVPIATTSVAGKVKPDGTTITVSQDGTISGATTYELPTMASNVKGGAKLGDGLSVSNDTLSADVTGVKGDAEQSYRTGDVNITPANIGALDEDDYLAGLTWDQLAARFTWDDLAGGTSTDAHTDNLDLVKPSRLSTVAVNGNMDIIDAAVGAVDVETNGSLQEQVTALGESVTPKNLTITNGPTTSVVSPSFAVAVCGMVFLNLTCVRQVETPAGNNPLVGTLEEGYRPSDTVRANDVNDIGGYVQSNGNVYVSPRSIVPAGTNMKVSVCFPIAQ